VEEGTMRADSYEGSDTGSERSFTLKVCSLLDLYY
jgi:hypothetical protein